MLWLHEVESIWIIDDFKSNQDSEGCVDVVCVTSAMSALEGTRRWQAALKLFDGLQQMSLEANGMTYTIATWFETPLSVDPRNEVLKTPLSNPARTSTKRSFCKRFVQKQFEHVWNMIKLPFWQAARAYLAAKKLRQCLQLLVELKDLRGETAVQIAANAAINACQLNSEWFVALKLYDAIRELGVKENASGHLWLELFGLVRWMELKVNPWSSQMYHLLSNWFF